MRRTLRSLSICSALIGTAALPTYAQISVDSRLTLSGECRSCDLSARNMSRLALNGADYAQSNFTGSNLSGGELSRSDLSGAQFARAYLMRTSGEAIKLRQAQFTDAVMIEASFTRSDISSADLRKSDMSRGVFTGSDFSESRLDNVEANGANFTEANFSLAYLSNGNFSGAIFDGAELKFTNFGRADLTDASFVGANLSGADLRYSKGLTQNQLDRACGSPATLLPLPAMRLPLCPEMAAVNSKEKLATLMATQRVSMPEAEMTAGQRLEAKRTIAQSIRGIDRALAALPPRGSRAAREELLATRRQLKALHDSY